jgi:hypothetical protein
MLATTQPALSGTTAQEAKASVALMSGANMNSTLLAPAGMITSLKKNLSASAMVCSMPKAPTTLGPRRRCTAAQILRSARIKTATDTASTSWKITMSVAWLNVHDQPYGRWMPKSAWNSQVQKPISAMLYSAAILLAPETNTLLHSAMVRLARAIGLVR